MVKIRYQILPPLQHDPLAWWNVLGVSRNATAEEIKKAYRLKMAQHHPDKGGDPEMAALINKVREQALTGAGEVSLDWRK